MKSVCHLPTSDRRGSLVVMAIIFLFVLSIIILAFQWSSFSTHKIFHHTYYSERAICLLDGLMAIARGVVQLNLDPIIEYVKVGEQSDLKDYIPGGITAAVKAKAETLKLFDSDDVEARRAIVPEIKVVVKMLAKDDFKDKYKTIIPDEKEKVGKIEITIEVQFKGFKTDFQAAKKTAKTQFEFKKIRAYPPFFRHFTLYVKKGIPKAEKEEEYADTSSNFNHLVNDRTGNTALSGGALIFVNGVGALKPDPMPRIGSNLAENPFYKSIPYIYIGGSNKAYLNLAAGGGGKEGSTEESVYGEDFHLYRGTTTDFYRVVATEFSNFLENAPRTFAGDAGASEAAPARGFFGWLKDKIKNAFSKISDFLKRSFQFFKALDAVEKGTGTGPSTNLPLYYVVRKDYGYASEWGENPAYKKFGFGSGKVVSSSLHFYGHRSGGDVPTPTVVLGNVYRRCLSLSGYKQRRSNDNPSMQRKFEVQAGPIEYFKSVDDLLARTNDWSKTEDSGGPIWVWDMRVDWSRAEDVASGKEGSDGTNIPISGGGLMGRIVPGLRKLWDDDESAAKKLFAHGIAPPDKLMTGRSGEGDTSPILDGSDSEEDVEGGVSVIYRTFSKAGGFDIAESVTDALKAAERGTLFGEIGSKENSAYFEEMMRCFCFASCWVPDALLQKWQPAVREAVEKGGSLWREMLAARREYSALASRIPAMDGNSIADPKKKPRWTNAPSDDAKVYPWSLPDPWSEKSLHKVTGNFEKAMKSAGDPQKLFDLYFKPMMTNPGRVLPYNYSLRFWFSVLKEIFTMSAQERTNFLAKEVIPEIRDGAFGYLEGAGNDYLKPKKDDTTDPPLNDEVLAAIFAKRSGDEYLKKGWFFMDDYAKGSVKSPKDVDIEDIFVGDHYSYQPMDQKQFEERFVKTGTVGSGTPTASANANDAMIVLGTVVKVKDLTIGPARVRGGGAIISDSTPIKISGNIKNISGGSPLVLKAPEFEIAAGVELIEAALVATKEFKLKGTTDMRIHGNIVAQSWDPEALGNTSGAKRVLDFDATLKSSPETPAYILNLEPRIRKYVIEAPN